MQFDAVSAGMSILPDRCAQAAFSEPEFQYTTALMVPVGNPEGLETMDSFVDSGLTVATMAGAVESDYAAALELDSIEVGGPQDGVDYALRALHHIVHVHRREGRTQPGAQPPLMRQDVTTDPGN